MSSHCPSGDDHHPSDCQILENYRTRVREKADLRSSSTNTVLFSKAEPIRLLLLDVDGVLTDGSLIYTEDGVEGKSFNTQDGLGIKLVQQAGIDVGLVTARTSKLVLRRAEELGMKYISQGVSNKIDAYKDILKQSSLKPVQVCYMGDDWIDLALLNRVGFAACPSNSVPEVKDACHFVSDRRGGQGAVREVCSILLQASGAYDNVLQKFMGR